MLGKNVAPHLDWRDGSRQPNWTLEHLLVANYRFGISNLFNQNKDYVVADKLRMEKHLSAKGLTNHSFSLGRFFALVVCTALEALKFYYHLIQMTNFCYGSCQIKQTFRQLVQSIVARIHRNISRTAAYLLNREIINCLGFSWFLIVLLS